jgi:hypothetical protein
MDNIEQESAQQVTTGSAPRMQDTQGAQDAKMMAVPVADRAMGLSMPVETNYVRPWYENISHSQFVMPVALFALFLLLAFNAYYLRMKQKSDSNIKGSVIWTNVLFALLTILLAAFLYLTYRPEVGSPEWNHMMVAT